MNEDGMCVELVAGAMILIVFLLVLIPLCATLLTPHTIEELHINDKIMQPGGFLTSTQYLISTDEGVVVTTDFGVYASVDINKTYVADYQPAVIMMRYGTLYSVKEVGGL